MKKILFIINAKSGTGKKTNIPQIIDELLDKKQFEYSIAYTEYAGHASVLAKEAMENGINIVTAVGGDGTVNEVARAIVHSNTALAIIPCGSGNGLARHLLLPMNIKKCINIINIGKIHSLDYGIINEYPFFCTCGMGFDAFISEKFAKAGKRGPVTYLENVLAEGLKYEPEVYEINHDGGTLKQKAFLVSCANASQYGNNAYIAPQASMSDGLLDVIVMEPFDVLDAPQISIDMFNKTLDKNYKIKTFKTRELSIKRQKEGVIHYDGDPVPCGKDISIKLISQGIKIVVNPNGDKSLRHPNAIQEATADMMHGLDGLRLDMVRQVREMRYALWKLQKKGDFTKTLTVLRNILQNKYLAKCDILIAKEKV